MSTLCSAVGGNQVGKGSVVTASVLDIAKSEGLVDLSLKPEFINSAKVEGSNSLFSKKVSCS